jgi:prevent-host-death family protein
VRLAVCIEICIVLDVTVLDHPHVVSVSDAAKCGVPRLVKDVEHGEDIVVERHGKAVAAVVSMRHLNELRRLEADLREAALILSRAATDTGHRTELDEALTAFGFDRAELEAELDADLAAGWG